MQSQFGKNTLHFSKKLMWEIKNCKNYKLWSVPLRWNFTNQSVAYHITLIIKVPNNEIFCKKNYHRVIWSLTRLRSLLSVGPAVAGFTDLRKIILISGLTRLSRGWTTPLLITKSLKSQRWVQQSKECWELTGWRSVQLRACSLLWVGIFQFSSDPNFV